MGMTATLEGLSRKVYSRTQESFTKNELNQCLKRHHTSQAKGLQFLSRTGNSGSYSREEECRCPEFNMFEVQYKFLQSVMVWGAMSFAGVG